MILYKNSDTFHPYAASIRADTHCFLFCSGCLSSFLHRRCSQVAFITTSWLPAPDSGQKGKEREKEGEQILLGTVQPLLG